MRNKGKIFWSYFVELLLSTLLTVLTSLLFDKAVIVNFVRISAIDFATLFCAIFLAAALAFLWTLYSKADSNFYRWLFKIDAFSVYMHATVYAIAVEAAATILLICVKYIDSTVLAFFSIYAFFLAGINAITLMQNAFGLMKLNAEFLDKTVNRTP